MIRYLRSFRGEIGQWGVVFTAVVAYILAAESGDYKSCCLVLLGLLAASLTIFRAKRSERDEQETRP